MVPALALAILQRETSPVIAPEQWKADLKILRRGLLEVHGGATRYLTPRQFDLKWSRLESKFQQPVTRAEGYLLLSRFTHEIRCGHTYLNFFNQDPKVQKELFTGRDKVPFTFKWVGNKMVVLESVGAEAKLPRGTEILQINGVKSRSILSRLIPYTRADGSNDAKRKALLGVEGRAGVETFDVFYSLLYPQVEPKFRFLVREPNALHSKSVTLSAIDLTTRNAKFQDIRSKIDTVQLWSDRMINDRTALLTMPTWELYNSKWDWKAYLGDFFSRLVQSHADKLIIDLRDNEGGNSVGRDLIPYFIEKPVQLYDFDAHVTYRKLPADLKPYLSTWDDSFADWGAAAVLDGARGYRLTTQTDQSSLTVTPAKDRFTGSVIVLMGPTNSSATFAFLSDIKRLKLGTLVGQPSGGNLRGINGGSFYFMALPNSKLEVDLRLIRYESREPEPDSGIEPDIFVKPTVEAIAKGVDLELNKAIQAR